MQKLDLSGALIAGFRNAFLNLGTAGKVVIFVFLGVIFIPIILRVISFFRRGGDGV